MTPIALPTTTPVVFVQDDVISTPVHYWSSADCILVKDNMGAKHFLSVREAYDLHIHHLRLMHQAAGFDDESEAENRRLANEVAGAIGECGRWKIAGMRAVLGGAA